MTRAIYLYTTVLDMRVMWMPACTEPVRVRVPSGEELELVPKKVWMLAPKGRKGVKIGLFKDPISGRYFRVKVPDDYPLCG